MSNSLTNKGQELALKGNGTSNGGLARLATKLKLYQTGSAPSKSGAEGVEFLQVANGNGYTTGGIAISESDFTYSVVGGNGQIVIGDKVFTASGGAIANIAGAYLTDAGNNVLAWFERSSPTTLASGESITLTGLTIRLT